MTRFVVGDDRSQSTLFPKRLDDYLGEDNPVRAIDVFVDVNLIWPPWALAVLSQRQQEDRPTIRDAAEDLCLRLSEQARAAIGSEAIEF